MNNPEISEKTKQRIYAMPFSSVYPLYIQKAERKGRKKEEVDTLIRWLTGYTDGEIRKHLDENTCFEAFFHGAENYNENAHKITGMICGYRIEEIEDGIIRKVRQMDKLIDELARGKTIEQIMR